MEQDTMEILVEDTNIVTSHSVSRVLSRRINYKLYIIRYIKIKYNNIDH